MIPIEEAVKKIITESLCLTKEERFLIIYDETTQELAEVMLKEALSITSKVSTIKIHPGKVNGEEPPLEAAEAMLQSDVCILVTKTSLSHTKARRDACKNGARIASMPGATKDMLMRTMDADYEEVERLTTQLKDMLDKGETVKITTKAGTDLTLSIKGREGINSGSALTNKGSFGNIPTGEAFIAPVEGSAQGIFVIDASILKELVDEPIKVIVKDGYAIDITGGMLAKRLESYLKDISREAFNIAELGIGTNKGAIITGNVLEDEKVYGTAHIAFGNNISFGGCIDVGVHIDGVFLKPTIKIDEKVIIEEGRFIFDQKNKQSLYHDCFFVIVF